MEVTDMTGPWDDEGPDSDPYPDPPVEIDTTTVDDDDD
jgi:hypothetical protein